MLKFMQCHVRAKKVCFSGIFIDVVEVILNGQRVGRLLWDPYAIELTRWIADGRNRLKLKVTSTGSNWLHGQTPSGVGGAKLYRACAR